MNNSQEKPDDVGEQENKEDSDYGSVSVYLSVHTAPENVNDVLEALGGRSAVFYFTGDEIAADPGAVRSVLGIEPQQSVETFLGGLAGRYRAPEGPCKLQGAVFSLDSDTGLCVGVERVDVR